MVEAQNNKFFRNHKFLVFAGIFLAIILGTGLYQYFQTNKNLKSLNQISYNIINNGGSIRKYKYKYFHNLQTKLATSSVSFLCNILPSSIVITSIHFENNTLDLKYLDKSNDIIALDSLTLIHAGITDENSKFLKTHSRLKELTLSDNKITDITFNQIKNWKNLNKLDLSKTNITDAGIETLIKNNSLNQLETLNLSHTKISDRILNAIFSLPNIAFLNLSHTSITDTIMEDFVKNDTLHELNLSNTLITDQSVEPLLKMGSLPHLIIENTQISTEGMNRLHKKYPWISQE